MYKDNQAGRIKNIKLNRTEIFDYKIIKSMEILKSNNQNVMLINGATVYINNYDLQSFEPIIK